MNRNAQVVDRLREHGIQPSAQRVAVAQYALTRIADDIGPGGGVLGARLTGAGFGGATVTLVEAGAAPQIVLRMKSEYEQRIGKAIEPFVAQPVRAAHTVDLSGAAAR